MKIKALNTVLLANDYAKLVDWYTQALSLEILEQHQGEYNYTELGFEGKPIFGIAEATEMEHSSTEPRNNSAVPQIIVDDIDACFKQVENHGGQVLFGVELEEAHDFKYGGFTDLEGNQIWVIEHAI